MIFLCLLVLKKGKHIWDAVSMKKQSHTKASLHPSLETSILGLWELKQRAEATCLAGGGAGAPVAVRGDDTISLTWQQAGPDRVRAQTLRTPASTSLTWSDTQSALENLIGLIRLKVKQRERFKMQTVLMSSFVCMVPECSTQSAQFQWPCWSKTKMNLYLAC